MAPSRAWDASNLQRSRRSTRTALGFAASLPPAQPALQPAPQPARQRDSAAGSQRSRKQSLQPSCAKAARCTSPICTSVLVSIAWSGAGAGPPPSRLQRTETWLSHPRSARGAVALSLLRGARVASR
ncbi:hypothetical protein [Roseiflexus sp.]|uniref:hypothetical protein n=1 Tax=Roseiflexus sp. TaxID=2562120 RepID=UPI00398B7D44